MSDHVSSALLEKRRASLVRVRKMAWWLDDAVRIPVLGKRIGIDGLAGLVPFAGDLVGTSLSSLLIVEAVRLGAPRRVLLRMGANLGVDFAVGMIPIVGDVFDFFYKANRRNERVLRQWLEQVTAEGEPKTSRFSGATGIVLGLAGACIVTLVLWRTVFG